MNKTLGIITARKNSRRLSNKNSLKLGRKTLVERAYEGAKKSKLDKVVISTDSGEIASLVPCQHIDRPKWLAQDRTPHLPVIQHAVEYMAMEHDYHPDAVMILQPTSPFREAKHINQALKRFETDERDSLVSVRDDNTRNAAIYITSTERLFDRHCYIFPDDPNTGRIVMDERSSIDINTKKDFEEAEALL